MARKKARGKSQPAKRPEEKNQGSRLRYIFSTPMRQLILIALFLGLLLWFRTYLFALWGSLLGMFGVGLALLAVTLLVLGLVVWKKPLLLFRSWNRWLGGFTFALGAMGLLSLFRADLAGSLGESIAGVGGVGGVVVLCLLGSFLTVPRGTWHLSVRAARGVWWLITKAVFWSGALCSFLYWTISRTVQARLSRPVTEPVEPQLGEKPAAATLLAAVPEPPKPMVHKVTPLMPQEAEAAGILTVGGWQLPPLDILDLTPEIELGQTDNERRARLIEEALASYGVDARVAQVNVGPAVTQFGVEPGWDRKYKEIKEKTPEGNVVVRLEEVAKTRVKVERITSLANDLALSLAAPSIRIEAPVPGKSMVGIEVPNSILELVTLRGVVGSPTFQRLKAKSKLALALGKASGGEAVVADLGKMPHLLIAGATGSGKTVCLNALIICLLLYSTPDEVRFIMLDPKRVEFMPFNGIPHLATPVIVDTGRAVEALKWLDREMDRRYHQMAAAGARNIEGYNRSQMGAETLPYLVLVIDELADLMMRASEEVEQALCRLAQLSRATGIHLVVATQRPSVDVVTGLIKANFPTRVSFAAQCCRQDPAPAGLFRLQPGDWGDGAFLGQPTETGAGSYQAG